VTESRLSDAPPRALVLAAGAGSRLRPLTDRTPKCLIPVGGRPLLARWRDALVRAGVREAAVNVHAHPEQVRAWIAAQGDAPIAWRVLEEPRLLGSAGALAALLPWLEQTADFVVIYADNLSDVDLGELVRIHRARGSSFTMALFDAPNPSACGIAELDAHGRVVAFAEKPTNPRSSLANAGLYVISRGVVGPLLADDAFDIGHDLLPRLVGRMDGVRLDAYYRDIGTPESLEQAERDVRAGALGTGG
jgi:mannose-1-phosphate guanylyltransferase